MATPAQFEKRFFLISSGVISGAARAHRNSAISVVRELARTTPVDTTLARSNWLANLDSADLSPRAPRSRVEVVAEARLTLSVDALVSATLRSQDRVDIHIANGGDKVPYLGVLNRGSSQQAPRGFVEIALRKAGPKPLVKARLLVGTRGSRAKGV